MVASAFLGPIYGGYLEGQQAQQALAQQKLQTLMAQLDYKNQLDQQNVSIGSLLNDPSFTGAQQGQPIQTYAAMSQPLPVEVRSLLLLTFYVDKQPLLSPKGNRHVELHP